jgi:hypothetical protein
MKRDTNVLTRLLAVFSAMLVSSRGGGGPAGTTLILLETDRLGVAGASTNLLLSIYGGSSGFTAFSSDPVRASVAVSGTQIRVFQGTSGTLCSSLTATSAAIPLVRENRPSVCTP